MSSPSTRSNMGWQMFLKVISSQTRVCHAPGTQWAILPVKEPLDDASMVEQMKRRSKRRIYLKMFLNYGPSRYSVIAHSNGFHHQIQWCACPGSPHITSNCSDMVCFQPVSPAKTAFTFDVLTIFTWIAMECKTTGLSNFPKLRRFTK